MLSINQQTGLYFEKYALKILKGAVRTNRNNFNADHDLLYDGAKINVKAEKLEYYKYQKRFTFTLHTCYLNCDYFLLIGYIPNGKGFLVLKTWLIPSNLLQQKGVTIGLANTGKFKNYELEINDPFKNKEKLIMKYLDAVKQIKIGRSLDVTC
jgi:hypothetical protein